MKFSIYINQSFCVEHGLSFQEATLLSALCEAPTWTKEVVKNDVVWYWISKSKLEEELPILGSWANFKRIKQKLKSSGFINYIVDGNKQLFRLTEKGKSYNMGIIVSQQGYNNIPVQGEDCIPNHNTIDTKTNNKAKCKKPDGVEKQVWDDFIKQRKSSFTETALNGFNKQALKAGWDLNEAFRESVERGWQSFKADWVEKNTTKSPENDYNGYKMVGAK